MQLSNKPISTVYIVVIISSALQSLRTVRSFCQKVEASNLAGSLSADYRHAKEYIQVGEMGRLATVENGGDKFSLRKHFLPVFGEVDDFFDFIDAMRESRANINLSKQPGTQATLNDDINLSSQSSIIISDIGLLDMASPTEGREFLETFHESVDYFNSQSQAYPCLHHYFGSATGEKGGQQASAFQKALSEMGKKENVNTEYNCKMGRKYMSMLKNIELGSLFNHNATPLKVTPKFQGCEYLEGYPFTFGETSQQDFELYVKLEYVPKLLMPKPDISKDSSQYLYYTTLKDLSPAEQFDFYIKIAERLDVIHSSGLVLHNFQPGNILVDENSQPLIIDFEMAQPVHNVVSRQGKFLYADKIKLLSLVADVPEYSSFASDIYAFGLTIFLLEQYNSQAFRDLMEFYRVMNDRFHNIQERDFGCQKGIIQIWPFGEHQYYEKKSKKASRSREQRPKCCF